LFINSYELLAGHFVSGLASGVASAVILQPLDLLKTRVQQSGHSSLSSALKDVKQSQHLVRTLWRGTVPSALRTGFGSAFYFTSLNAIREKLRQTNTTKTGAKNLASNSSSALPVLSNTANLLSGAAARTLAGLLLMPLTVIKVRFESSLYSYPSIWSATKDIHRRDGLRGFFSGFGATAIRDAPYAGMYVLFYEALKSNLVSLVARPDAAETRPTQVPLSASMANTVNFFSGLLAGAACSAISNPFDVVKTRIQLEPRKYGNLWRAWYTMAVEEGFRSLWDGLALRMSRKALSSALAWTVYEQLIRRS
jgi:solute carrier family 25 protein 38